MIAALIAFTGGVLTWSFAEYLIHRFLGHSRRIRSDFGKEHIRHHAVGSYFAPAAKKLQAAVPILTGAFAVALLIAGPSSGAAYGAGLSLAYLSYELLHRRAHTHPPRGPYGRWVRRHHFHHHFEDPKTNHGVTSPLGDILFGTLARPGRIHVPERLAMEWLLDPADGEVRAPHRDDYALLRRPS